MTRDYYYWEGVLREEVRWAKERRDLGIGASCFEGNPRCTAVTELVGNDTVIPKEAWTIHGEDTEAEITGVGIFDGDSDRDPRDPENHHQELENLAEEDIYPGREDDFNDKYSIVDEDPADIPDKVKAEAGVRLIEMLGLDINCSREVCDVVGVYLNEQVDGVLAHYFRNLPNPAIVSAVLNFLNLLRDKIQEFKNGKAEAELNVSKDREDDIISEAQAECFKGMLKIKDFLQTAISSRAKARLIGKAQYERQEAVLKYLDAMPSTAYATLLGAAVFGREKFQRLLRATV